MGKAIVKTATFKNEWNGPNGTVYYHDIEFTDGTKGQYGSKTKEQNKFVPGQEVEYTSEPNGNYPPRLKPVIQQNGASQGYRRSLDPQAEKFRQMLILAQSSMTKCVDMAVHKVIGYEQLQTACDRLMQQQIDLAHKYQNYEPL